jgi:hypothetical protein
MHEMKTKQQRMGEAIGEEEGRVGREPTYHQSHRQRLSTEMRENEEIQIKNENPTSIEQEK